jgi:hypothetical protein
VVTRQQGTGIDLVNDGEHRPFHGQHDNCAVRNYFQAGPVRHPRVRARELLRPVLGPATDDDEAARFRNAVLEGGST